VLGYFSDRHLGPPPRVATEIPEAVSVGIDGLIRNRAHHSSFGLEYPEQCPEGRGPAEWLAFPENVESAGVPENIDLPLQSGALRPRSVGLKSVQFRVRKG